MQSWFKKSPLSHGTFKGCTLLALCAIGTILRQVGLFFSQVRVTLPIITNPQSIRSAQANMETDLKIILVEQNKFFFYGEQAVMHYQQNQIWCGGASLMTHHAFLVQINLRMYCMHYGPTRGYYKSGMKILNGALDKIQDT